MTEKTETALSLARDVMETKMLLADVRTDESGAVEEIPNYLVDTLDGVLGAFDEKMTKLAYVKVGLVAEAETIRKRVAHLQSVARALEARAESVAGYMLMAMREAGVDKVKSDFSISHRSIQSCSIDDESSIPQKWMRVKTEPNKVGIMKAIKAGEVVPGASIKTKDTLFIR